MDPRFGHFERDWRSLYAASYQAPIPRPQPVPLHEPIPDDRMALLIKERHRKDDLQDAWLDIFLANLHKNDPTGMSQAYNLEEYVHTAAMDCRLYETLQGFLNYHNGGVVDLEIDLRLNERVELFKRRQKYPPLEQTPPAAIKSSKALLDKMLPRSELPCDIPHHSKDPAERDALRALANSISEGRQSSLFAVGGKIGSTDQVVRVWWKTNESEGRISFPADMSLHETRDLIQACVPATFGRGQEDVLDERYRKVGKLAVDEFLTDFCPYKEGIVNQVIKFLGCVPEKGTTVKCEMYNLNIYSGPGSKFESHVDTSRGAEHFASLVICLPSYFDGGDLEVRHNDQVTSFRWDQSTTEVQWAAFYSDCEHKVKEVRSGNRITLTYNLFWMREESLETTKVDPDALPVTQQLRDLLDNPNFFPQGIVIGVPCSHYYAHNTRANVGQLPSQLKGSDGALRLALDHLGVENELSPILSRGPGQYGGLSIDEYFDHPPDPDYFEDENYLREFQNKGFRIQHHRDGGQDGYRFDLRLSYVGEDDHERDEDENHFCAFNIMPFNGTSVDERVAELQARRVLGLDPEYQKGGDVVVAHSQGPLKRLGYVEGDGEGDHFDCAIDKHYPHTRLPQVVWLHGVHENLETEGIQMAYMAYGNESSLEWNYSRLAHLFIIPPAEERKKPSGKPGEGCVEQRSSLDRGKGL